MTDTFRHRAEDLFQKAADLPPGQRTSFLVESCGDDARLREEVESLLDHLDGGRIVSLQAVEMDDGLEAEFTGEHIGPYRIVKLIGEGGFGSVYLAEQVEPLRREVALKIIKLGMDTKQIIARFDAERQALAMMDHPNIARVLDAGATDTGRPYFVMELVKGVPITEYCDEEGLAMQARLELFVEVCLAVQHAHQKGIIHRDIKPSNVLVTMLDGKAVPKVIDFGIAKATDKRLTEQTFFTEFQQFIGTPAYMSPEQAEMSGLDVDTRTDIYSLGVLLYVLLTGKTPFEAAAMRRAALSEVQRIIREQDPPTPSQRVSRLGPELDTVARSRNTPPQALTRLLRGELDWIVMKALEKDRSRRYETAAAMAADVRRHLTNEPVSACPPGTAYRMRKFVRRHRVFVGAGTLVAAALLIGLSLALYGMVRARQAQVQLQEERDTAETARIEAELARQRETEQRLIAEDHAAAAREKADNFAAINSFLQEMLASAEPRNALGREVTIHYVMDEASRWIAEGSLEGQPEVEAAVRMTLGITYQALGLYTAARTHFAEACKKRSATLGKEDPATLRSLSRLAEVNRQLGNYEEAEILFRRTLDAQRRVLGKANADTLYTMNGLGIVLWHPGGREEAEHLHRRALEIQLDLYGEEDARTLRTLTNLGTSLWGLERIAEAEKVLRRALHVTRRVQGEEHPDTQVTMNNMGLVLEAQSKFTEAEALFRQSLESDRDVLGVDHPKTQIPLNNLLRVLRKQGKWKECRPLVQEQIEQRRRAAEKPDASALALNSYAWMLLTCEYEELRDPVKALPAAQRAVEIDGGRDANILDTLALACFLNGDVEGAIEHQRLAAAIARPGTPYKWKEIQGRLLQYLWIKGDFTGVGFYSLDAVMKNLATKAGSGETDPTRLAIEPDAIMSSDLAEAEALLRDFIKVRKATLPKGHWMIAHTRSLLGEILTRQGRYKDAEPLLIDGCVALCEDPDVDVDIKNAAFDRIIDFYIELGREDQAAMWSRKLVVVPGPEEKKGSE